MGKDLLVLHELAIQDRHRALPVRAAIVEPSRVELRMSEIQQPVTFRQLGLTSAEITHGGGADARAFFEVNVLLSELPMHRDPEIIGLCRAIDTAVTEVVRSMRQQALLKVT